MNSDFSDLLSLFNRHRVRYLVAGGYAVIYYTNPRYTKDLDVVVALTDEDTSRAVEALGSSASRSRRAISPSFASPIG